MSEERLIRVTVDGPAEYCPDKIVCIRIGKYMTTANVHDIDAATVHPSHTAGAAETVTIEDAADAAAHRAAMAEPGEGDWEALKVELKLTATDGEAERLIKYFGQAMHSRTANKAFQEANRDALLAYIHGLQQQCAANAADAAKWRNLPKATETAEELVDALWDACDHPSRTTTNLPPNIKAASDAILNYIAPLIYKADQLDALGLTSAPDDDIKRRELIADRDMWKGLAVELKDAVKTKAVENAKFRPLNDPYKSHEAMQKRDAATRRVDSIIAKIETANGRKNDAMVQ